MIETVSRLINKLTMRGKQQCPTAILGIVCISYGLMYNADIRLPSKGNSKWFITGCPNRIVLNRRQSSYFAVLTTGSWWSLAWCLIKGNILKIGKFCLAPISDYYLKFLWVSSNLLTTKWYLGTCFSFLLSLFRDLLSIYLLPNSVLDKQGRSSHEQNWQWDPDSHRDKNQKAFQG